MSGLFALWRMEWLRLRCLFGAVLVILLLLTGIALKNGADFYGHQQRQQLHLQHENAQWVQKNADKTRRREQTLRSEGKPLQPDTKIYRNPAYLANTGPAVTLPPLPSQALGPGDLPHLPTAYKVSLLPASLWQPVHNIFHPLSLWLGVFDWGMVLAYGFPLCLMLLGLDLLADERLRGHLPLYATYQWTWARLLMAKLTLRIVLSLLLLLCMGLEAFFLSPVMGLPITGTDVVGALTLSAFYSLFWWGLMAVLHVVLRSPAQIGVVLSSLWFLWAWIVPAVAGHGIRAHYPVPSRFAYLQQYRETEEQVRKEKAERTSGYLEAHPELNQGADNTYALKQFARAEALSQALLPVVSDYDRQLQARLEVLQWVRFLSPIYAHQWSLQRFWGSDRLFYGAYLEQLESFSNRWQGFFLSQIQQGKALDFEDFGQFPVFEFKTPEVASRWQQALAGLGVWGLFLLLGAAVIWWRASVHPQAV